MIDAGYVRTMAQYGAWQNQSLLKAANQIDDKSRRMDRGAFFKSIYGTLNHLLWGDRIWMSRFAGTPGPRAGAIKGSAAETEDWESYCSARSKMDTTILSWASDVDADWLAADLSWFSGAAQRDITKPKSILVMHFFNHGTHHRGQVHAMLTAAGAEPDDTDLFLLPRNTE